MTPRIHNIVMKSVVDILNADEELARSGCSAIAQNEQELATLLQIEMDKLDGPVLVVAVNGVRKIHSNPVKWAVEFSVNASEYVPLRDGRLDFVTAIDAAMAAGEAVERAGIGHFDNLSHTTPGDGVLESVANCSGEFTIEEKE